MKRRRDITGQPQRPRRTPWRTAVAAALTIGALGVAHVAGCLGPTLPLPPPSALVEAPDAEGFATVVGEALPGAYVLVLNLDTDQGVIGRADDAGRYRIRIRAEVGHTLEVWQMTGSDSGPHRTAVVPAR